MFSEAWVPFKRALHLRTSTAALLFDCLSSLGLIRVHLRILLEDCLVSQLSVFVVSMERTVGCRVRSDHKVSHGLGSFAKAKFECTWLDHS